MHNCSFWIDIWFYQGSVRASHACKHPIAPMGRWLTCPNRLSSFNSDRYLVLSGTCTCLPRLQTSHRPDGNFTCFALVLAGRRCVHLQCHSELLIVHHHGQHGSKCACSRSKVPIAPMGKLLTHLPQLSLAHLRPTLRSTSGCTCRRELQKFPSPRWDFHMFCACDCRVAVSTSMVAR